MATGDAWPYPKAFCPGCGKGFVDRAELVAHQFDRRHWRPLPPPDPAGAAKLREAIEAAQARRRKEARDGLS
jgi:hypothetical protein